MLEECKKPVNQVLESVHWVSKDKCIQMSGTDNEYAYGNNQYGDILDYKMNYGDMQEEYLTCEVWG